MVRSQVPKLGQFFTGLLYSSFRHNSDIIPCRAYTFTIVLQFDPVPGHLTPIPGQTDPEDGTGPRYPSWVNLGQDVGSREHFGITRRYTTEQLLIASVVNAQG